MDADLTAVTVQITGTVPDQLFATVGVTPT